MPCCGEDCCCGDGTEKEIPLEDTERLLENEAYDSNALSSEVEGNFRRKRMRKMIIESSEDDDGLSGNDIR